MAQDFGVGADLYGDEVLDVGVELRVEGAYMEEGLGGQPV